MFVPSFQFSLNIRKLKNLGKIPCGYRLTLVGAIQGLNFGFLSACLFLTTFCPGVAVLRQSQGRGQRRGRVTRALGNGMGLSPQRGSVGGRKASDSALMHAS
jgi:hypothetical protein